MKKKLKREEENEKDKGVIQINAIKIIMKNSSVFSRKNRRKKKRKNRPFEYFKLHEKNNRKKGGHI